MDVLLARDGDLLRLVFEVLDVVVDVENVFVKLGKVVELRGKPAEAGVCAAARGPDCWKPYSTRTESPNLHLLSDSELEALPQLCLLEAVKVLV